MKENQKIEECEGEQGKDINYEQMDKQKGQHKERKAIFSMIAVFV